MEQATPNPVYGFMNTLLSPDPDGDAAAVIVNPDATPAQRISWALGQLTLALTVARLVGSSDSGNQALREFAQASEHMLQQAMSVLESVQSAALEKPLPAQLRVLQGGGPPQP